MSFCGYTELKLWKTKLSAEKSTAKADSSEPVADNTARAVHTANAVYMTQENRRTG